MITTKDRQVFAMALVLLALMFIFVPVASAGSNTWYTRTDSTLNKVAPGLGSYGFTGWHSWYAGPTQCVLTMGAGTWTLYLDYDAPCTGFIGVQVLNQEDQTVLAYKYNVNLASGTSNTIPVVMTGGVAQNFDKGEHLELAIGWYPDTTGETLTINCGSAKSTLTSPSTDPGYPVPEMSTLALFSVGLLALVGYVVYRRRQI